MFRKEVIEHMTRSLQGDVLLVQPFSYKLLTTLLLLIVAIGMTTLLVGNFNRTESVQGYIVPNKGIIRIFPNSTGSVLTVEVNEGDYVQQGDVIATVYTGKTSSSGNSRSVISKANIDQEISLLKEKSISLKAETQIQQKQLTNKMTGLEKEKALNQKALKQIDQRLWLHTKRLNDLMTLKKNGYVSDKELFALKDQKFNLESQKTNALQTNEQLTNLLNDYQFQSQQLPISLTQKLSDITRTIEQLENRSTELLENEQYAVVSQISGQISSLSLSPGQLVQPSKQVATVTPDNTLFEAKLFVPSRAAGFLELDQQVNIRYAAFPYQRFGMYFGKIKSVPSVIFKPSELDVPVVINEPVYRVTVSLETNEIKAAGKILNLQPGMLLEADIQLEERTFFEWLIEPLLSTKGKG